MLFFGCEKEEVETTETTTINAYFRGEGRDLAEAGPYYGKERDGEWKYSDDIFSVFIYEGNETWCQMPYTDSDGDIWYYKITNDGALFFYAQCEEGYHWTRNFYNSVKVKYRVLH